MPFASRSRHAWKLRNQLLALGERTLVMGVLNVTPDSFSEEGGLRTPAEAIEHGLAMFDEGADIVDIGGESTRPGKRDPISVSLEMDRVLPVIEGLLRHRPGSILSIDTYKAATASAALRAGAQIVNDVSGFLWDETMAQVCAIAGCGVVLTHTRGRPEDWSTLPAMEPGQVIPSIKNELQQRLLLAGEAGIDREQIVLDPGFGFGKVPSQDYEQNYTLLAGLERLSTLSQPLLIGVSRKAFLGRTLSGLHYGHPAPVNRRGNASLAAATAAILLGAHLVRVHDVQATREAAAIADAVLQEAERAATAT